ncbi:bifunctional riboflavin kinase/FAD synthetase [Peptoniphilaceae bacterium SGI.131]
MIKIIDLDKNNDKYLPSVIGLGNFDGLHIGHRDIMAKVMEIAKKNNILSSVLLFKQHTNEVFTKMPSYYLTSLEDKIKLLEEIGIDQVFIINFTMEFAQLSNEEFMLDFIRDRLNAGHVVCGQNYTFGKFAKGTVKELLDYKSDGRINLDIVDAHYYEGRVASSTMVRDMIRRGDVETAAKLLTHPYSIKGRVVHGFKRGSSLLGFPTANIELSYNYIVPDDAVYLTEVLIDDKLYYSLTSVGTNPTFTDDRAVKIEVFIIDHSENLYGRNLEIGFIKRLRGQIKFDSSDGLINQMNQDLKFAREYIAGIK